MNDPNFHRSENRLCQHSRSSINDKWTWTLGTSEDACGKPAKHGVMLGELLQGHPPADFSQHGKWAPVLSELARSLENETYWVCEECFVSWNEYVKERRKFEVGDEVRWLEELYG